MGDPQGIGPEIIVRALVENVRRWDAGFQIYGDRAALRHAATILGLGESFDLCALGHVQLVECGQFPLEPTPEPAPSRSGGEASHAWVVRAIDDALRPATNRAHIDALVTAPISKTSWNLAGHTAHPGHTELIGERAGARRTGMMFVGPHLRVMLATIHEPLMRVGTLLDTQRVLDAIELAHRGCLMLENAPARIAVCGLNPHAGEAGLLGSEDTRVILPAINAAIVRGISATGPFPADTLFSAAAKPPFGRGVFDCVVAMYHDQGLIPVKLIDGFNAVNLTVLDVETGRPSLIRTSPAHGTAFDIAGQNIATADSMTAAIDLAVQLVKTHCATSSRSPLP